jgi:hypothetical protein
MSQMNNITARNLYEFGDYFKKSLIMLIIVAIVVPVVALILFVAPITSGFLGLLIAAAAIAALVFQILMLIRLYRAKESSPHPELIKSFQLIITAIIVSAASIVFFFSEVLQEVCSVVSIVLTLIAWISLGKYIEVFSSEASPNDGFTMVAGGIKLYVILTIVNIAINAFDLILGFFVSDTFILIMTFVVAVIAIIVIVAQFKIANGIINIFSNAPPMPSGVQYGAPQPPQQPQQPPTQTSSGTTHYCSKCGAKVMEGAKFCPSCGETLN